MFVPYVPAVYTSTSNLPSDFSSIISLNLFAYKSCTSSCPSSCANFNVIVSPSEPPSPFPSSSPSPSAPESPHATKAIDKINMNTIRKILLFFNTLYSPLLFSYIQPYNFKQLIPLLFIYILIDFTHLLMNLVYLDIS